MRNCFYLLKIQVIRIIMAIEAQGNKSDQILFNITVVSIYLTNKVSYNALGEMIRNRLVKKKPAKSTVEHG